MFYAVMNNVTLSLLNLELSSGKPDSNLEKNNLTNIVSFSFVYLVFVHAVGHFPKST
jgi:hypothetical protein